VQKDWEIDYQQTQKMVRVVSQLVKVEPMALPTSLESSLATEAVFTFTLDRAS
jgi:hypothetical protein